MRQRGGSWELRVYLGRDPATGTKRYATQTVRGGKREAQRALSEMVTDAQRACHCGTAVGADGFVFSHSPDASTPWFPGSVSRSFKQLCAREGIDDVRLHDLRHFVATQLLSAGVDVRTVAGRLGHRNAATTLNVYAHFLQQADRVAADVIGNIITNGRADNATRTNT